MQRRGISREESECLQFKSIVVVPADMIKRLPEKCFIMYTAYLLQAMEISMSVGLGLYVSENWTGMNLNYYSVFLRKGRVREAKLSRRESPYPQPRAPQKPAFTCDSTPSFRRNVTAYPNSPNDFAKFELDSYFLQNASASKIETEIENSLTIF